MLLSQTCLPGDQQRVLISVKSHPSAGALRKGPGQMRSQTPSAVKKAFASSSVGADCSRASPGMSRCAWRARPGQDCSGGRARPCRGISFPPKPGQRCQQECTFGLPYRGDLCHLKINTREMMRRVVQLLHLAARAVCSRQ